MRFSATLSLLILAATAGGMSLVITWVSWLMSQPSDAAFVAGPLFLILAISAAVRIIKFTLTTKGESH